MLVYVVIEESMPTTLTRTSILKRDVVCFGQSVLSVWLCQRFAPVEESPSTWELGVVEFVLERVASETDTFEETSESPLGDRKRPPELIQNSPGLSDVRY